MLEAGGAWLDQNLAQLRDRGRRAQDWTERVAPPLGRASRFVWEVLIKYHRDDCFTYAASLSFFLTISLIPLATLFFRLMAILLGSGAYSQALYRGLLEMYPYLPEGFIQDTIVHSRKIGGVGISWAILLIGAHWGVNQVDRSLCHIFDLRAKRHRQTRKHNLLRRLGVILLGLAFLVILLSAGFEWSLRRHAIFPPSLAITVLPALLGLILVTLILQHLPRRHVRFRHAFLGALVATGLWWLAKLGFGTYYAHAKNMTWGILYGSLSSLMAALIFLYYSCCIFLLGVEVTAAFYRHEGPNPPPESHPRPTA
ncbi:MAG TPA: YihY/virulence factor BrkB family protein [Holophaga sp.]|jgi:membrane protein|nr:YihY/virulence factor BrkB family protein [Holophaga sp.]